MADSRTSRTLREIVRVIFSRMWGILMITAVVVAAVWLASTWADKWYRSEVQLLAKPARGSDPLEKSATARDAVMLFVTTQRQVILSDYVVASALMKLQGEQAGGDTWTSPSKQSQRWYSDEQVQKFVELNGRYLDRVRKWVQVVTPGGPDASFTQTFTIRVDWPEQKELAGTGDSKTVAAQRAYQFTQNLMDAYLFRTDKLRDLEFDRSRTYLSDQALAEAKAQANTAAADLNKFLKDNNVQNYVLLLENMISGVGETGSASMMTKMQTEANMVRDQLAAATALRVEVDKQLATDEKQEVVIPDLILASTPALASVQQQIVTLKLKENSLASRFTDDYQELRDVRSELKRNNDLLRSELQKQLVKLDQQIAPLEARLKEFNSIITADSATIERLGPLVATYRSLRDRIDSAKRVYDTKLAEVVEARSGYEQPVLISALDAPTRPQPDRWRRPIILLNVLVAVGCGLVLALVWAFMADYYDHSLKSIDEAERFLGAPVLANIPKLGRQIIAHRVEAN